MANNVRFVDDESAQAIELAHALAGGTVVPSGWFAYRHAEDCWYWSDELAKIYGYHPGDVVPTAELLLSHRHPDDADLVLSAETLGRLNRARTRTSLRYRMIDRHGREHVIVAELQTICAADDRVIGIHGHCIDVRGFECTRVDDQTVEEFRTHRARIEQVKGWMMAACGFDEDAAFAVLKWCSQTHNVKLWVLADRVASRLPLVNRERDSLCGPALVELLLTEACGMSQTPSM